MTVQTEYSLYLKYLKENLSLMERFTGAFSGQDDRLDFTNLLLIKILMALSTNIPGDSNLPPSTGIGYPPNANGIKITTATLTSLTEPTQLPSISIPEGFKLIIKASPLNTGTIYVLDNSAGSGNLNVSYPLIPGDVLGMAINNANLIYISGTVVGDSVICAVEQRFI